MGGIAALSAIVMVLWNQLLPDIFGLATINFWQALGLFTLARLLFGRFGGGRGRGCGRGDWKGSAMSEKWANMTTEERKEFICKRRIFGFGDRLEKEHFDTVQDEASKRAQ